jgi:hypothetical protein
VDGLAWRLNAGAMRFRNRMSRLSFSCAPVFCSFRAFLRHRVHTLYTQSNRTVETRPWKQLCGRRMDRMLSHQTRPTTKLHIYAAQFCLVGRTATSHTQREPRGKNSADRAFTMGGSVPGLIGPVGGPGTHIFHSTDQPCATCLYAVASGCSPHPAARHTLRLFLFPRRAWEPKM